MLGDWSHELVDLCLKLLNSCFFAEPELADFYGYLSDFHAYL